MAGTGEIFGRRNTRGTKTIPHPFYFILYKMGNVTQRERMKEREREKEVEGEGKLGCYRCLIKKNFFFLKNTFRFFIIIFYFQFEKQKLTY